MVTVRQSLFDFNSRPDGGRTFDRPPTCQRSCRNGLLHFTVMRVQTSRGMQSGWLAEVDGSLLMWGNARFFV